jgi:hypothetical protein
MSRGHFVSERPTTRTFVGAAASNALLVSTSGVSAPAEAKPRPGNQGVADAAPDRQPDAE